MATAHDYKVRTCDYLATVIHPDSRKVVMRRLLQAARSLEKEVPFDALAFVGTSGLLVGPQLADKLNKPFVVVHKPGVSRHGSSEPEGILTGPVRYVFVDDQISSGKTLLHTKQTIERTNPASRLVGLLLYHEAAHPRSLPRTVCLEETEPITLPCRRLWSEFWTVARMRDEVRE